MREPPNLVELLMTRFPLVKHSVYGNCVIIPRNDFRDDWTEQLRKLGANKYTETDFVWVTIPSGVKIPQHKLPQLAEGHTSFVNPTVPEKEPTKAVVTKKRGRDHWSDKEDALLIKIANSSGVKRGDVPAKYLEEKPKSWTSRSVTAVAAHIKSLMRKGLIKKLIGKGKASNEEATQSRTALKKSEKRIRGPRWNAEEDRLLIKVALDESLKVTRMYPVYCKLQKKKGLPFRSKSSFIQRKCYLKSKGLLVKAADEESTEAPVAPAVAEMSDTQFEVETFVAPSPSEFMRKIIDEEYPYSVLIISDDGILARIRKEDVDSWRKAFKEALKA